MPSQKICVIGLGYVGLTLSLVLADHDFEVYGVEKDPLILGGLKGGRAHFFEKNLESLLVKNLNKHFFTSNSIPKDKKINAFVITVGTPIEKTTRSIITKHIAEAVQEIAENLEDGQLVILRSTVAPGTTRELVLPILEKTAKKFYLAFCPERTIEGAAIKELETLPQIIGGVDEESTQRACEIFQVITKDIIRTPSVEYAEMSKIICNTYRDLTFAYANEVALLTKSFGLDANKLIEIVNFKYPRGVSLPGFVGGPCLSKDSFILTTASAEKVNFFPKLINTARELNESVVIHVAEKIAKSLRENNANLGSAKVFITGFAFKGRPETDDLRDSPTIYLLEELRRMGIKNIQGHDFVVNEEKLNRLGIKVSDLKDGFRDSDVVVMANNHLSYSDLPIEELILSMRKNGLFFDVWHIFEPERISKLKHVTHEGLGFLTKV